MTTTTATLLERAKTLRSVEGWKPSNTCAEKFTARIDKSATITTTTGQRTPVWVITAEADGKQYIYQPSQVCSMLFFSGGGSDQLGYLHIEGLLLDRLVREYQGA